MRINLARISVISSVSFNVGGQFSLWTDVGRSLSQQWAHNIPHMSLATSFSKNIIVWLILLFTLHAVFHTLQITSEQFKTTSFTPAFHTRRLDRFCLCAIGFLLHIFYTLARPSIEKRLHNSPALVCTYMGPHKISLCSFGEYKFVNNKACHPEHDVHVWGFNFHRLQIISGQYKNTSSATQFHSGMHHIGLLAPYFVCVALYSLDIFSSWPELHQKNFFLK